MNILEYQGGGIADNPEKDPVRINGASIDNLAYQIQAQADRLFPDRTDQSMFMKLFEEIGELVEKQNPEELADVLIMLLDFASRKMWDIEGSIRDKMQVNENRAWIRSHLGVMHHAE